MHISLGFLQMAGKEQPLHLMDGMAGGVWVEQLATYCFHTPHQDWDE